MKNISFFKDLNIYSEKLSYNDNRNIYFKNKKVAFLLTPKTGSTSLRNILRNLLESEGLISAKDPMPSIPNHLFHLLEDVYKVGVVRNPYDRLASVYNGMIKYDKNKGFFKRSNLDSTSFDSFARGVCDIPDFVADKHFKSQYTFITAPTGEFIIDKLLRFESYKTDLLQVFAELKLPIVENDIPHKKNSKKKLYTEFYTPELAGLVGKRYALDLKLFGYEFAESLDKNIWKKPMDIEDFNVILKYKSKALFKEYYKYKEAPLDNYSLLQILKTKLNKRLNRTTQS